MSSEKEALKSSFLNGETLTSMEANTCSPSASVAILSVRSPSGRVTYKSRILKKYGSTLTSVSTKTVWLPSV